MILLEKIKKIGKDRNERARHIFRSRTQIAYCENDVVNVQ
jgi:hypothetical protein